MKDFSRCPACGYSKGFHVSFRAEQEHNRVVLICPSCAAHYDAGWLVSGLAAEAEQV
jgi:hypothetical protein